MKPAHVILSVLGGAIAGAAVGLLLAPDKGETTREQVLDFLREKGKFLNLKKNRIEELADEIADELDKK